MEWIEVTVRVNREGARIPFSFTWAGVSYRVDSVGRRWVEEDGEHILVMAGPNNQVFELLYVPERDIWGMVKKHEPPHRQRA
jgi:hypothetical protein